MNSTFTFVYNALSQGYPVIECLFNLLPISDEIVIVDCGSTDGTKELLNSLTANKHIRLYHDSWEMGLGGRNYRKSASKCHSLCTNETIIFAEADEVWPEDLVLNVKEEINAGNNNLILSRYQLTQNFSRVFWYPEAGQRVHRVFPRNSTIMQGVDNDIFIQDSEDAKKSKFNKDFSHIIDCRNNFRDNYITREEISKVIWNETSRKTFRFAPAHASYGWEISREQLDIELKDERWTDTKSIFNLPKVLKGHVGKTSYKVNENLVDYIKYYNSEF